MSKIISVILSIVLLLGIFPMQVFAEEFEPMPLEPELNKVQLQTTVADALSEFILDKIDQEPDEIVPIYAYDSFGGTYSDDFHYTEDCHYTLSSREDGKYNMGVWCRRNIFPTRI